MSRILAFLLWVCVIGFPAIPRAEDLASSEDAETPSQLVELKEFKSVNKGMPVDSKDSLGLRAHALREAAVTMGIQNGIKYRYGKINSEINYLAAQLDHIYDFKPLLIREKMLPPVVVEADGASSIEDDGSATASMVAFEVVQDAKLVLAPPQWRDYLLHDFPVNTDINPALHPKDDAELEAWSTGVQEGWEEGVQIADRMAVENINRLVRDYRGIVRFHWLAQQGVLTMPVLSVGDLDVYVNGKKMDVNKRIFRITAPTGYRSNTKDWKLSPTKQRDWENQS